MRASIGGHIRANLVGYVALFFALGMGSAYAANTIGSTDIIDGQVKSADLADNGVNSVDPRDGQVMAPDIHPDAVHSSHILDGQVNGADVRDETLSGDDVTGLTGDDVVNDSLKGDDVDESTLDLGPLAAGVEGKNGFCSADSGQPENCVFTNSVNLVHSSPMLVAVSGNWQTSNFDDADDSADDVDRVTGLCQITVDGGGTDTQSRTGEHRTAAGAGPSAADGGGTISIVDLTPTLAPGWHVLGVECTEIDGDIDWTNLHLAAISAG